MDRDGRLFRNYRSLWRALALGDFPTPGAGASLRAVTAEWNLWPYAPAVRSRNGISYLTVRRFSAQNRLGAIRAVKQLKSDPTEREIGLAAAEIAVAWSLLTGNPVGWTVTNIAAGHSGGSSFGARLAAAVAERLMLDHVQVWRDRPIGLSAGRDKDAHPGTLRRVSGLVCAHRPQE
jgi:hypothetical protein